MKKLFLALAALASIGTWPALAADLSPMRAPLMPPPPPPSPWDIAFGGALMSDYNFRGISQSNKASSVTAYAETRYTVNPNWQLYAGSQYWAVTLPTKPSCECDLYGGIRPTFGAWAFDFGYIYYWYPKEQQQFFANSALTAISPTNFGFGAFTLRDTDYWEVYGKVTIDVIKDRFAVGANVYYSPSWLHTGATGVYAAGTAKFTGSPFPLNFALIDQVGWYLSGEVGHYSLGTATNFGSIALPDYWTWNAGLAFTWKVFTLDVRYYDTDLNKGSCFLLTGDPRGVANGQSNWCGSTVIGKFSADLTAMTNLK